MKYQYVNGFALISALVVVALVTSVSVALAVTQRQGIELTTEMARHDQLRYHADAVLLWADGLLRQDLGQSFADSPADIWNTTLAGVPIESGRVSARIEDLQGRFNLNNLGMDGEPGATAQRRFRRLLQLLFIRTDITDAVADWIDTDGEIRFPNGSEDDYYLSLDKPYRAANQAMVTTDELLMVKDVTRDIYSKLSPFVSALPAGAGININTASDTVLMTLSEMMDEAAVESLSAMREQAPFTSIGSSAAENGSGQTGQSSSIQANDPRATNVEQGSGSQQPPPDWTWTALKSQYEQQAAERGKANPPADNAGGPGSQAQPAPGLADNTQTQEQPDAGQAMSLAESEIASQYGIDMTGLTTTSSFFRVRGLIEQHDRQLPVHFDLFRDAAGGENRLLSRNYSRTDNE